MSANNPRITLDAMRLLSALLLNGGFCTVALAAAALDLPIPETRKIIGELVALGYLRKVFLLRAHDASNYFQITRRAARMLGHPAPNCARSDPADSQILRGMTRFWFAFCSVPSTIEEGQGLLTEHLAHTYMIEKGMTVPPRFPVGDTYIEAPEALHVWFFPGPDQSLTAAVKQAFLRYSDDLDKVKVGFVIDRKRAPELAEILSEIAGEPVEIKSETALKSADLEAEIATLRARFAAASAMEKASIQSQIQRLEAQKTTAPAPAAQKLASTGGLADVILPIVVHDLY